MTYLRNIAFFICLNKNSYLVGLFGPFSMPLINSFEIHIKHIHVITVCFHFQWQFEYCTLFVKSVKKANMFTLKSCKGKDEFDVPSNMVNSMQFSS